MLRLLLNLAAALSTLFLVASFSCWVYACVEGGLHVDRSTANHVRLIRTIGDRFPRQLEFSSMDDPTGLLFSFFAADHRTIRSVAQTMHLPGDAFELPGFTVWRGKVIDPSYTAEIRIITVDFLLLFTLTLILPFIWAFIHTRKRFTRKPGHCRSCGYNLTANTTGVCSECGSSMSDTSSP